MKWMTVVHQHSKKLALGLSELEIVLLEDAWSTLKLKGLPPSDLLSLIQLTTASDGMSGSFLSQLQEGLKNGALDRQKIPASTVQVLSPIPRPVSVRDGYAFRQHVEAARRNRGVPMIPEFDHFPIFYFTNALAITGPGELPVQRLALDKLDFELEVAVVIGRGGKNIPASKADEHIFGYMIMNDWSARTLQMEEMKLNLGPAKGKDFATSLGPWLVTRDELASHRVHAQHQTENRGERFNLRMRTWVNDQLLSEGNLKDMSWTFAEIIERASYGVHLEPGEVIGSGTVGTGCLLELNGSKITDNLWLKPGDHVKMEVESLGTLINTISEASESYQSDSILQPQKS
jgi:fumarylacetoacetate (FAA) hydrolase